MSLQANMNIKYNRPEELVYYAFTRDLHFRAVDYPEFKDALTPKINEVYELWKIFGSLDLAVVVLGYMKTLNVNIYFKFNFPVPTPSGRVRDVYYKTYRGELIDFFKKQFLKAQKCYNQWLDVKEFSTVDEWDFYEDPFELMEKLQKIMKKLETSNYVNIICWNEHYAMNIEFEEDETVFVYYLSLDCKRFYRLA